MYRKMTICCENGTVGELTYFLRKDRRYGVEVELRRGAEVTDAVLPDLAASEEAVCALLARLADATVTPCALREVWEENFREPSARNL